MSAHLDGVWPPGRGSAQLTLNKSPDSIADLAPSMPICGQERAKCHCKLGHVQYCVLRGWHSAARQANQLLTAKPSKPIHNHSDKIQGGARRCCLGRILSTPNKVIVHTLQKERHGCAAKQERETPPSHGLQQRQQRQSKKAQQYSSNLTAKETRSTKLDNA